MLYQFLRNIFRFTNKFYFKSIHIKGLENIPKNGPVFLVANHPGAFLDPLVIATVTSRPLFFLAKGVLFQNKFLAWLLPKCNVIPIFRRNETPGQEEKNKEVFSHCHKHFAKGGAILVFPEGISLTERRIQKIKTGTARISLGAEEENNFKLNLKILPVGLNYSNPHKFQSDLFINIDQPICASDYQEFHQKDPFQAALALSDEIRTRLEQQVLAVQNSDVDRLVANIELIYKLQLLKTLGHKTTEKESDFKTTKGIIESVHHFIEVEPLRVEKFKSDVNAYLDDLERLSLNDQLLNGEKKSRPFFDAILSMLYLILGFPLFIFGLINNFLPFKIPGWTARRIGIRREFYGAISVSLGTITFLIFYTVQILLSKYYFHDWRIILAYTLLLPISGLFAFSYYRRFTTIRGNWKVFSLFYKKNKLIASLILKREEIIQALEKGKDDFLAYRKDTQASDKNQQAEPAVDLNSFSV